MKPNFKCIECYQEWLSGEHEDCPNCGGMLFPIEDKNEDN